MPSPKPEVADLAQAFIDAVIDYDTHGKAVETHLREAFDEYTRGLIEYMEKKAVEER